MSDYEDDEIERELEAARAADRQRTRSVVKPVAAPQLGSTASRCMACGFVTDRLGMDPLNGGRVVCTARYSDDKGKPVRVDCYDKLDRELADRNGRAYIKTRDMIRAAKEKNRPLNPEECAYLVREYGKQSAQETIDALEARAQRAREGGSRGGRKAGLDGV